MRYKIRFFNVVLIIGFALLMGANAYCKKSAEATVPKPDSLSFIVIGDWGRYGNKAQKAVAERMSQVARLHHAKFIITTGDNFYPNGVRSINDAHWQQSYEEVYHKDSMPIRWYPVLGNHDYVDNPQAQIDYTTISNRWFMPARYHATKQPINGTDSLLLVFTDTSPYIPYYYNPNMQLADLKQQDTAVQTRWLQAVLQTNDKWKIVIGHHPFYSAGQHGNNISLMRRHKPILLASKTDFYIAGHDHDLQYLKKADESLHYLVSGGGSEIRTVTPTTETVFAKASSGFLVMTLYSQKANFYFYDQDGHVLYQQQIEK